MGGPPAQTDDNLWETLKAWGLRHPYRALTLLTVAALAPFLARPFNIDEPLFIWVAQQIHAHPADPFGFNVNWYGSPQPMWDIMQNPPLMSYYLAAVATFIGWSETGLHAACLLPAVLAVLGTCRLAAQLCRWPLVAGLLTLFAPGFLVSSTTVMCDVAMLAFWVWAVVFWTEGIQQNNRGKLAAAGLMVALAMLTKYNGLCLIPLLAAHALMAKRGIGSWVFFLLIPVAALGANEWATFHLYGHPHFLHSNQFAHQAVQQHASSRAAALLIKVLNLLTFAGGCFAIGLFCAPWLWSRRAWLMFTAGSALFVVLAIAAGMMAQNYFWLRGGRLLSLEMQIVLWSVGGVSVLALAAAELWQKRGRDEWLLAFWVTGIVLFATFFYWMVNIRVLLPMVPAIAILITRRLEQKTPKPSLGLKISLMAVAALSLWVAEADFQLADTARNSAQQAGAKYGGAGRNIWFEGHWGFQYYMQSAGARPLDMQTMQFATGDLLIIPEDNANVHDLDPKIAVLQEDIYVPSFPWLATLNIGAGAGFYSQRVGPLPFAFGHIWPEDVAIYRLQKPAAPAH